MIIDTRMDQYPITTSLRFRLFLALLGKGALVQHKGKLYQAVAYMKNNSDRSCAKCAFKDQSLCEFHHLWDVCVNIEDAYKRLHEREVDVIFEKYTGKLPPDEIVIVF